VHAAANRDPKKFACPVDIDLGRSRLKDHLAFNFGPRACVGAGLARAEMHDSIQILLDRLPNLRLDPAAEAPRFGSLFMRSWRPLHVIFEG
jgi:cytochrome P450